MPHLPVDHLRRKEPSCLLPLIELQGYLPCTYRVMITTDVCGASNDGGGDGGHEVVSSYHDDK